MKKIFLTLVTGFSSLLEASTSFAITLGDRANAISMEFSSYGNLFMSGATLGGLALVIFGLVEMYQSQKDQQKKISHGVIKLVIGVCLAGIGLIINIMSSTVTGADADLSRIGL